MALDQKSEDSNEIIHAMVIASQKVLDIMGKDLASHFFKYKVFLITVAPAQFYGADTVSLILEGKQNDIKNSLNNLKKICYRKEAGIEDTPIKSLPPILKRYLFDIEDETRFKKLYSYCSKEYLNFCTKNNIKPHPEVIEQLSIE